MQTAVTSFEHKISSHTARRYGELVESGFWVMSEQAFDAIQQDHAEKGKVRMSSSIIYDAEHNLV